MLDLEASVPLKLNWLRESFVKFGVLFYLGEPVTLLKLPRSSLYGSAAETESEFNYFTWQPLGYTIVDIGEITPELGNLNFELFSPS